MSDFYISQPTPGLEKVLTKSSEITNDHIIYRKEPNAAAPAAALAGVAGNIDNGSHDYAISFVTPQGETEPINIATVNVVNNAVDGQVSLTVIPTGSVYVTARNIWRTEAGQTQLKYLDGISDNTSTTYNDNIADINLGINAPIVNSADDPLISFINYEEGFGTDTPAEPFHFAYNTRVDGRVNTFKGTQIAASADLPGWEDANYHDARGAGVTVNAIKIGTVTEGTLCIIKFLDINTLKHNTAGGAGTARMQLAGSIDATTVAGCRFGFLYDGTDFIECFRTYP